MRQMAWAPQTHLAAATRQLGPRAANPPRRRRVNRKCREFSEATLHSNTLVNSNPSFPFSFQFLERDFSPGQPRLDGPVL